MHLPVCQSAPAVALNAALPTREGGDVTHRRHGLGENAPTYVQVAKAEEDLDR